MCDPDRPAGLCMRDSVRCAALTGRRSRDMPVHGSQGAGCSPARSSLIPLTRNGVPVLGMMHQPFIGERFTGDGGAAQYRGPAGARGLHVRPCARLADAMMFTTSPRLMNEADRAAFGRVEAAAKLSR